MAPVAGCGSRVSQWSSGLSTLGSIGRAALPIDTGVDKPLLDWLAGIPQPATGATR
ncbi:MAG: hypothetical protein WCA29_09250 [Jiangellales bacterium]